jgi:hypothetical protein
MYNLNDEFLFAFQKLRKAILASAYLFVRQLGNEGIFLKIYILVFFKDLPRSLIKIQQ